MVEIRLSSSKYFTDLIGDRALGLSGFVWRGQQKAVWPLQSSFDRLVTTNDQKKRARFAREHLSRFKLASRGRRGPSPRPIEDDDEWWAIAQHNAMATPLLDWSESPFVALYFAFEKEASGRGVERAVWGLHEQHVKTKMREIRRSTEGEIRQTLEFIRPMQDENLRLVSQAGLFTKLPIGVTVEQWVADNFRRDIANNILVKIVIPNREREDCLKTLNRMNINHLSLFPDLYGAGKHCNHAIQIADYSL